MRHERTETIIFRQVLTTAAESSNLWSPLYFHGSSVRCQLHSPPTHGKDASGSLALARFAASNEECCGSWQTARGCPEEINVDFRSPGDPIFPHLYMFRSICSHAHGPRGSQMRASSARPGETDHVSFAIQARELQNQLLELIQYIAKTLYVQDCHCRARIRHRRSFQILHIPLSQSSAPFDVAAQLRGACLRLRPRAQQASWTPRGVKMSNSTHAAPPRR